LPALQFKRCRYACHQGKLGEPGGKRGLRQNAANSLKANVVLLRKSPGSPEPRIQISLAATTVTAISQRFIRVAAYFQGFPSFGTSLAL
jgi:hypothetical protein